LGDAGFTFGHLPSGDDEWQAFGIPLFSILGSDEESFL
jgi:hypothetical protein